MARSADWTTLRRHLADMLAHGVSYYDVQSHLLSENKKRGHCRCTGRLHLDGDGVPTLGYCGRWTCWKCANTRLWLERRRMLLGASALFDTSGLWFVTVTWKSTHRHNDTATWRENTDALIDAWRRKAVRAGVEFVYCHVTGFKPSNGEIHAHVLVNWCPSPVSRPTPSYPDRHGDTWLEPKAAELGLTLWIELAQSPDAVAVYSARNLESVAGVVMPSHFQRVKYSRSWPKLPPKEKPDALIEFGEYLGATITVSDNQLVTEKTWMCPNCGQQIFGDRDGLPLTCDYCGDATTWTPLDGDTLSVFTQKVSEIPDTATAPAPPLNTDNPDVVQLALEPSAHSERWPDCRPDVSPVSALTERANKTARCGALHRAVLQTSEYKQLSDGLYHAFRQRTPATPCHRRKRTRQHCRREKPP